MKIHKTLKTIILMALVSFLVVYTALNLFTDNQNRITGAAVTEPEDYIIYEGTYSIKPSFKVNVDYNMNDYKVLKQASKEILRYVAECEKTKNLNQCVSDGKIKLNETLARNNLQFVGIVECGDIPKDMEKRIYGFCVKSNKEVLAYNPLREKTDLWPVLIKFALYFPEKSTSP